MFVSVVKKLCWIARLKIGDSTYAANTQVFIENSQHCICVVLTVFNVDLFFPGLLEIQP